MFPKISPIIPVRRRDLFESRDWVYELKHDGFRALAYLPNGRCRLVSRRKQLHVASAYRDEAINNKRLTSLCFGEPVKRMSLHTEPTAYSFDIRYISSKVSNRNSAKQIFFCR